MSTDKAFEYLRQFYNPYHGKDGRFTTSRGGATVVPWGSPSGRGASHPGAASGAYAAARAGWKPRAEGGKFVSKTDGGPGKASAPAAPKSEWQIREEKLAARRKITESVSKLAPQGMGMDRERGGSKRTPSGRTSGVGGWAEQGPGARRSSIPPHLLGNPDEDARDQSEREQARIRASRATAAAAAKRIDAVNAGIGERVKALQAQQGPGVRPSPASGTSDGMASAARQQTPQEAAKWAKISAGMAKAARQKTLQAERQAARLAAKQAKLSDGMAKAARQKTLQAERGMGMDRERSGSRRSPSGGVGGWAEQGPGVRRSTPDPRLWNPDEFARGQAERESYRIKLARTAEAAKRRNEARKTERLNARISDRLKAYYAANGGPPTQ